ncbi:hypothetical protein BHE74_00027585, partial [Ensete ventricosum]
SSPKVSGACWEFVGSSPRVIGGLSGVHLELTEGDRKLARNALGVHQKITKRLIGSSLEFTGKIVKS